MALKDLENILKQVHEPDEYKLIPHDMNHSLYWIWKLENAKLKDLDINLRSFRPEHARFDIFINGQYILENDYVFKFLERIFTSVLKNQILDYSLVAR